MAALVIAPMTVVVAATPAAAAANINVEKSASDRVLVGGEIDYSITLTAGDPDGYLYNVSFRDVLPAGVEYAPGSTTPESFGEPTQMDELDSNGDETGRTILAWTNVADVAGNEAVTLQFRGQTDQEILPSGAVAENDADVAVSEEERIVPRLNADGEWDGNNPDITVSSLASASTEVTPITIDKLEDSPENELMRGVQDNWTTYTLRLSNNHANETDELSVVDYLPAGLEFLGCRTNDNSTVVNDETGEVEEYADSGPLNAGSGPENCYEGNSDIELVSVSTVAGDDDGLPSGTSATDVFTRVEWVISGEMAPGATLDINYAAGIPLRENTLGWGGETPPSPESGEQAANLDNNTGAPTRELAEEDSLTNYASVTGTYLGPDEDGNEPVENVGDDTSYTVSIEDVRIVKSVSTDASNNGFRQGQFANYTLDVRVSQYVTANGFTVVDELPNGLCPVGATENTVWVDEDDEGINPADSGLITDECVPPVTGAPSVVDAEITQIMARVDGTFQVTFELIDDGVDANGERAITYSALMRSEYTMDNDDPTAAGDSFTNDVSLTATTTPVDGNEVDDGDVEVYDVSEATITAGEPTLEKRILANTGTGYVCDADGYFGSEDVNLSEPDFHYTVGSRICFELVVNFSNAAHTKNPVLSDFLPDNLEYVTGSLEDLSDEGLEFELVGGAADGFEGNVGVFQIGTVHPPSGDRFVELGDTFHVRFSTIVTDASRDEVDVHGNLAKVRWENTDGQVQSLRDQVDFSTPPPPPIEITKNASPEDVEHGETVTYTVTLEHGGDPAIANDVPMHNIEVWDVLPAAFECTDVTEAGDANCTDPGDIGHPTFEGNDVHSALVWTVEGPLEYDGQIVLDYTVTIPTNTSAGATYTNTAHVHTYETETNWVEDDEPVTNRQYPADNVDTELNEEDWSVPEANDDASVTLPGVTLEKGQDTSRVPDGSDEEDPAQGPDSSSNYAVIGEQIEYTVTATLPANTTVYNGVLSDEINDGLRVDDVTYEYNSDLNGNGVWEDLPTGFMGTDEDNTVSLALPATPESHLVGDTDEGVRMTILATVLDESDNSHGDDIQNQARFDYTTDVANDSLSENSNTTEFTVVEPVPNPLKTVDNSTPSATEKITYTVTARNIGNGPTLYDVELVDCVPAGLNVLEDTIQVSAGFGSAGVTTEPCGDDSEGTQIIWSGFDLPWSNTADWPTLTYSVSVDSAAGGGATYRNDVVQTGSSRSGDISDERTYSSEANQSVTVPDGSLEKTTLTPTARVGDIAKYQIEVTIPRRVNFYGATIADTLPTGIDPGTVDLDETSVTCTQGSDNEECSTGNEVSLGDHLVESPDGQLHGWALGDISASDQTRTLTFEYSALVTAEEATNTRGDELQNSASLKWFSTEQSTPPDVDSSFPNETPDNPATITVTEPNLVIDKKVNEADAISVEPGDTFTYEVTITNDNDGDDNVSEAFNITVIDEVPRGVVLTDGPHLGENAPPSASVGLSGDHETDGGGTITYTTAGPLNPGDSFTFTYEAELAPSINFGNDDDEHISIEGLRNIASVDSYESLPDGGREYDGPSDEATVTPQFPDLSVIKTATPSTVTIGGEYEYRITVSNGENAATASEIRVEDLLPEGFVYVTDSARVDNQVLDTTQGDPEDRALTWAEGLPTLGQDESFVITYQALVDPDHQWDDENTGDTDHVNTVVVTGADGSDPESRGNGDGDYEAEDRATVQIHRVDLAITKGVEYPHESGTTVPGAQDKGVVWTIDVQNLGPNPEVGPITVTDTLPNNFIYTGFSSDDTNWTCPDTSTSEQQIECIYAGDLAPGDSLETLRIHGTIHSDAPVGIEITNTAEVSGTTFETDTSNNDDSENVSITPIADLGIEKSLSPNDLESLVAGTMAMYEIAVTNYGPSTSHGPITVTDVLPDYLEFQGFIGLDEEAWDCVHEDQEITCVTDDLTREQSRTITFGVTVAASHDDNVVNTATVTGTTPEGPDEEPNTSTSDDPLDRVADLELTKNLDPEHEDYVAGTEVPFVLTVHNHGPSTAQDVAIVDQLEEYLTFERVVSTDGWTCEAAGQDVTCELADEHGVGEANQTTLVLWVTIDEDHVDDIDNAATVSTSTEDPNEENDSDNTTTRNSGQLADLAITKTRITDPNDADAPIIAGEQVEYQLVVTNTGPSASGTPVEVTDIVPDGFTFTGFAGDATGCTANEAGDRVICTLDGPLSTAETDTKVVALTFDTDSNLGGTSVANTARVDGPYDDPESENNQSTTEEEPITDLANLVIEKTVVDDAEKASGSEVDWTVTVENEGPSDAQNVVVRDQLPAGITLVDMEGEGWDCETSASALCTMETLVAGETATITVTTLLSSAEPAGNTLVNTATVETSTEESNEDDNEASDDITTYTEADLEITKSHTGEAVAGESLDYTIEVRNNGPSDAQGPISVTDTLPEGMTFAGVESPCSCLPSEEDGQVVDCVLQPGTQGIMAETDAPELIMTVDIAPDMAGETLVNSVNVSSPTDDPDPSNNEDEDQVTPEGSADLSVVKTHNADDVRVGDEFDFTIEVTNNGPSEARGVVLEDLLPEELTLIEISGTDWTCEDTDCAYAHVLAPGASAEPITVTVEVTPAAYPSVINTVVVDSDTPDPNPGNNEDEDPVEVPAQVDLAVVKTSDAQFKVGDEGRYSFTVTNAGPTADPGPITVTDELPAGITFVESVGDATGCEVDGQVVTCVITDGLGVDGEVTFDLLVDVAPAAEPEVTNTATVDSPSEDTDPENNTSTVVTPVEPTAILTLEKTLGDTDGDAATWHITVTNEGPSATDEPIVIVDDLPNLLSYTSHSGDGWVCDVDGQTATCTYEAPIAAGDSVSVAIDTTILATDGSEITNTVTLTSGGVTSDGSLSSSADVTAPDESDDGGWLSRTGFDNPAVIVAALVLLLGGAAFVVVYMRKKKHTDA